MASLKRHADRLPTEHIDKLSPPPRRRQGAYIERPAQASTGIAWIRRIDQRAQDTHRRFAEHRFLANRARGAGHGAWVERSVSAASATCPSRPWGGALKRGAREARRLTSMSHTRVNWKTTTRLGPSFGVAPSPDDRLRIPKHARLRGRGAASEGRYGRGSFWF